MAQLKLRKTGNSLSTTWPKELLSRRNVKEGDRLFVIETRHGVMVTPYGSPVRAHHAERGRGDRALQARLQSARGQVNEPVWSTDREAVARNHRLTALFGGLGGGAHHDSLLRAAS